MLEEMLHGKPLQVKVVAGVEYVSKVAYDTIKGELDALQKEETSLRRSGMITEEERESIKQTKAEHTQMNVELTDLASFIAQNYKEEIEMGLHGAFKNVTQAVMYYLGRERAAKKGMVV